RIEKAGFSDIRLAEDHHIEPVADLLPAPSVGEMLEDFGPKFGDFRRDRGRNPLRQILIGKVDIRLKMGERGDQPDPPALIDRAEFALHLTERLTGLRLRLRIDEIAEAFRRGEIHLAMLERAAGKLAGLGRPKAG